MKRVWTFLVVAPLLGLTLVVATNAVLYDGLVSLLPEDTVYSSGFDEERFRALVVPVDASTVLRELGEPLYRWKANDGLESWIYSKSGSDTHYRERIIRFRDGSAVEKHHEFYVD